jgi:hypothetical protein
MGVSPSKKVKSDPIDIDDFDCNDGDDNKDFKADTHDLKIHPQKMRSLKSRLG